MEKLDRKAKEILENAISELKAMCFDSMVIVCGDYGGTLSLYVNDGETVEYKLYNDATLKKTVEVHGDD